MVVDGYTAAAPYPALILPRLDLSGGKKCITFKARVVYKTISYHANGFSTLALQKLGKDDGRMININFTSCLLLSMQ